LIMGFVSHIASSVIFLSATTLHLMMEFASSMNEILKL